MRYREILEACWKGYHKEGMKKKGDRMVSNCVPVSEQDLEEDLRKRGKNATFHVYAGTDHAFFNDERPEVYNAEASSTAWRRTLALFRANL
jgi:dienelactone hydrolase